MLTTAYETYNLVHPAVTKLHDQDGNSDKKTVRCSIGFDSKFPIAYCPIVCSHFSMVLLTHVVGGTACDPTNRNLARRRHPCCANTLQESKHPSPCNVSNLALDSGSHRTSHYSPVTKSGSGD